MYLRITFVEQLQDFLGEPVICRVRKDIALGGIVVRNGRGEPLISELIQ